MKNFSNRLLSLILVVIMLLPMISAMGFTVSAATYSGNCGDNLTWTLNTSTGVLDITGTGEMNNYLYSNNVPWFSYFSYLKTVNVSNGVTSIGSHAFDGCTSLTSVSIPNSVTSIGFYTFYECTSLSKVYITDLEAWCKISFNSSYSNPLYYAKKLYLNSILVTNLEIPDSVTNIGSYAFYGCSSLTSVSIPDSVTSIDRYAFEGCTSLSKVCITDLEAWCEIDFGYSTSNPLYYAKNLYLNGALVTNLKIHDSVTSIGRYVFYRCTSLASVSIPDSVTSIGSDAFYGCSSLISVYITDLEAWCEINFSNSESNPLYYAENLYFNGALVTNLEIPDSVTSIGSYAFYGYTSLTSVIIPDTVISIGSNVFYGSAYYENSSNWENGVLYIDNHLIKAEISLKSPYSIKEGSVSIAGSAFSNCTSLKSIDLPDSLISIGSSAFSNCKSLKSIDLPDSLISIGSSAFYKCSSLTSISIPDTVKRIGSNAFNESAYYKNSSNWENSVLYIDNHLIHAKTTLKSLYSIKEGTLTIAENAFESCATLVNLTIPNSVISINNNAFIDCIALTSVKITDLTSWCKINFGNSCSNPLYYSENLYFNGVLVTNLVIPDSVTSIGDYAFNGCNSFMRMSIPDSVTSIGESAFENCGKLISISIPDSVTSIGNSAFGNCTSLKSATVGNSVTELNYVFEQCDLLTDVTIGNCVKVITGAFRDCKSLNKVIIPGSVTTIGDYTFYNCTKLASVTVPVSVTSIGNNVFHYDNNGVSQKLNLVTIKCYQDSYAYTYAVNNGFRRELIAENHSFTNYISDNNAGCVTNGTKTALCNCGCGATNTIVDENSKLGHLFENYISDGNASCLKDGTKTAKCNRCNVTDTVTEEDSALGHVFTNHIADGNATCLKDGTKTAKCNRCNVTDTVSDKGSALGHEFTNYISDGNASCLKDGTKTAKCNRCNVTDTVSDKGSALGHEFTNYISDGNATCLKDGTKTAICNRKCGAYDTVTDVGSKDSVSHKYQSTIIREASCSQSGLVKYMCNICSDYYTEGIPTVEHVFKNYIFDKNATCISNGTKTAYCSNGCGASNTVDNTDLVPEDKLHNYTGEILEPPTCSVVGTKIYICSLCRDMYTEDIPTVEHRGSWGVTKEPTVKEEGINSFTCVVCGFVIKTEKIDKLTVSISFPDVPKSGSWYSEGVYYCAANGYITGTDKGTFDPNGKLAREQFVVILARVSGADLTKYTKSNFSDVDPSSWYGPCVIWAYTNGFVYGVGDGSMFGVGQDMSREQLATMFYRYAKQNGVDTSCKTDISVFEDNIFISSWSQEACSWAINVGLVGSINTDRKILAPRMVVTRAQAAKIFMNYDSIKNKK